MKARAAIALAVILGTADAFAQSSEEVARAREEFATGLKLEDSGAWGAALEAFRKVAAVRPTPQVRYHLGLCLEHVGRLLEAQAELARAEREAKAAPDPEQQLVSARAGQRAAQIRARTPRLTFAGTSARDVIRVDGQPRTIEAGALAIDPGERRVVVERGGTPIVDRAIVAQERDPGEVIAIDVAPRSTTAAAPSPAPWIAGGVAVVAILGAGTTALLRSGSLSDLDRECGPGRMRCPESVRPTFERAETLTTLTNVFLVTAGVAAIAAGALWLTSRSRAER